MKLKNVAIFKINRYIDKNTLGIFRKLNILNIVSMWSSVQHDNPIFWAMPLTNIVK